MARQLAIGFSINRLLITDWAKMDLQKELTSLLGKVQK